MTKFSFLKTLGVATANLSSVVALQKKVPQERPAEEKPDQEV